MEALLAELDKQIAAHATDIVIYVLAFVGWCALWLLGKVKAAAKLGSTAVEVKCLEAKLGTPVALDGPRKLGQAIDLAYNALPKIVRMFVSRKTLGTFIERGLNDVRAVARKSIMPPPAIDPSAGTLLAVPPRSPTGFSGDKFKAVTVDDEGGTK